jgi:sugar phosphate isomerase/epimerase
VERTAEISLGLNWDNANTIAYGDDPIPVLRKVVDRVVSVHAGTGLVPFDGMFTILRGSRFDGWICIEEASFTGATGVKVAADFIRPTWDDDAHK